MVEQSHNFIGKLATKYEQNPAIQSLVNLIPIPGISSLDTLLIQRANEIKQARSIDFFDALAQGRYELTEEKIKSEDFLHAFFCTYRAAINTRQREKIIKLANLLNSSINEGLHVASEEYEELLSILDEISLREFSLLNDLKSLELQYPILEGENELQNSVKFWTQLKTEAAEKYNISPVTFNSYLARLERTGLYLRITGNYWKLLGLRG